MSFEMDIPVQDVSLATPSPEALEAGVPPHVELAITAGLTLPFAHPETGQPLTIGVGKYKFVLARPQAIEVFKAGLKAAESLPEEFTPSGKVVVASNMSDVERAAANIKRVTGK